MSSVTTYPLSPSADHEVPVSPSPRLPKSYVAIDLETTGLNQERHGIVQIGAWATGEREDDFRGYFVRDTDPHYRVSGQDRREVRVDREALGINGFTSARIDAAKPLYHVLREFYEWLKRFNQNSDLVVVGQNTPFDVSWLKRDFHDNGFDIKVFRRVIDTATMGFLAYGETMGLAKMSARLGIRNGGEHDALADAMTTSKVFHRLRHHLTEGP